MNDITMMNYLKGLQSSIMNTRKESNEYNIRNLLEVDIDSMGRVILALQNKINFEN